MRHLYLSGMLFGAAPKRHVLSYENYKESGDGPNLEVLTYLPVLISCFIFYKKWASRGGGLESPIKTHEPSVHACF